MKINIVSKHLPVTDAMRAYAEKKMPRITKYFDVPVDVTITFSVQKNIQIAEVLLHVKGLYLKGIEKSEDIYASLDLSIDKIERQIVRYKDRIHNRKHDISNSSLRMNVYNASSVETDTPEIVISKEISAKPMAVEEAVMQMNLLDKPFFVFRSAVSEEINVVYKRDDGNIGLIEP
ncbi:MAG: ribosome-associated translation inhibitor RaiA [Deferribacteraceae bacterium]|jgi:putative sigma-54 modulation protein|nr:ribosome-associated translation inhibitor RaiA [Deferribacteraceae bacterium]